MRAIVAGVLLTCLLSALAHSDAQTARTLLRQAFAASEARPAQESYELVRQALADPGFDSVDASTQHAALELAYRSAYAEKEFVQSHAWSTQASALPQQTDDDWLYRLKSAAQISDGRDEAFSIIRLVELRGATVDGVTLDVVMRAYRDTRLTELAPLREKMLLTLYEHRWRPLDGASASFLWRSLSLMLLEGNDAAKAAQVVTLVDEPTDVIAMHADRRYAPLLKSAYFESNAHDAAKARITVLRQRWAQRPRSLDALMRLAHSLLVSREDGEVLALTDRADQMIAAAGSHAPPFDDIEKNYAWILNEKSEALEHLGRYEDAVSELRRALNVPKLDKVSQPINLARLLCDMNRAAEALNTLPTMDDASDFGKVQIALVRLMAATELGEGASIQENLRYLEDHQDASPAAFQRALVIAGEPRKAEAFLLSRLADPERRTAALLEMQIYADWKAPTMLQAWRDAYEQLKAAPNVRQAVAQVGAVGRYTWRYE